MKDDYDDYDQPAPRPPAYGDDALAAERSDWYAPEEDSTARTFLFKYLPVLFLCFLALGPTAMTAKLIWQDDTHITNNFPLKTPAGLGNVWIHPTVTPDWAPLSYTLLWPQQVLWGTKTTIGYHLVSLFLHSFNAIMVWMLLKRLDVPGALVAAFVYAVHPMQAEAVLWAARQPMVFGTFWGLLSALLYLRYSGADNTVIDPSKIFRFPETPWLIYTFAIITYSLAVLSQPLLIATLPIAMVLAVWWKRADFSRGDLLRALPLILIGLAGVGSHWLWEIRRPDYERDFTALEILLVPARAVWFYLTKAVLPLGLATGYRQWQVSVRDILQWLALVSVVVMLVALWAKRRDVGRAPVAILGAYLVLLLPMITPLNRSEMADTYVADRFHYVAMIVPAGLIVGLITEALQRIPRDTRRWIAPTAAGVLTLVLAFTTMLGRARSFASTTKLWEYATVDEDNTLARVRLGQAYQAEKRTADALREFERVDRETGGRSLEAKLAMGEIAEGTDKDLAVLHYRHALELAPHDREPYRKLGPALLKVRKQDEAIAVYEEAVKRFPNDADLHRLMGWAKGNNLEESTRLFERSIELDPQNPQTHVDFGTILTAHKKYPEAEKQFVAAIKIDQYSYPAFFGAGRMYLQAGNTNPGYFEPAYVCFRSALYLATQKKEDTQSQSESSFGLGLAAGKVAQIHWYRGDLAIARNKMKEASSYLQKAIELRKEFPEAQRALDEATRLAAQIEMGPPRQLMQSRPATSPTTRP